MLGLPHPVTFTRAGENLARKVFRGGVADLSATPSDVLYAEPQGTLSRYRPTVGPTGNPVLLVPPLAAPALCYDLRQGCSLAGFGLEHAWPTYLVDYGKINYADRALGLEHWVLTVLPHAIRAVSEDCGGRPVQLVGWSLGGVMSLLAIAADATLPVDRVAMVGSPIDTRAVPMLAPVRPIAQFTDGRLLTLAYRLLGGAPAPLVQQAFQISSLQKYVTKPVALLSHLDDTEFLAQIEGVDRLMGNMAAYPGRTFGQLYHRFFRDNELAKKGTFTLGKGMGTEVVNVRDVTVPVMAIAGRNDVIAPAKAVHAISLLLPDARLESAPGGHLGVITGRQARTTTWPILDDFFRAT